jgi:hypothetical protein
MADYTFPTLTTAVVGFVSTTAFQVQSTSSYIIEPSNGTVRLGNITGSNFSILTDTRPGYLTGRRPVSGQVFPRGVYNK